MSIGTWLPEYAHTHAHTHTHPEHSASHTVTQRFLPQDPLPPASLI